MLAKQGDILAKQGDMLAKHDIIISYYQKIPKKLESEEIQL